MVTDERMDQAFDYLVELRIVPENQHYTSILAVAEGKMSSTVHLSNILVNIGGSFCFTLNNQKRCLPRKPNLLLYSSTRGLGHGS